MFLTGMKETNNEGWEDSEQNLSLLWSSFLWLWKQFHQFQESNRTHLFPPCKSSAPLSFSGWTTIWTLRLCSWTEPWILDLHHGVVMVLDSGTRSDRGQKVQYVFAPPKGSVCVCATVCILHCVCGGGCVGEAVGSFGRSLLEKLCLLFLTWSRVMNVLA